MKVLVALMLLLPVVMSCNKPIPTTPLTALWFANAQSINYLNVERLALDLRADSTYRYYYRNAPIPPAEVGDEYTEGGTYNVRGDSLRFSVLETNGAKKSYDYARKFRVLADTAEWPLRVTYSRKGTTYEVYFQAQK
ncbi:MAG: hypothetical protein IPP40_17780 [bacterium]|nr:hypothetical protein [bacterium]